ncbi:hypothetical protein D918_10086 [Trichuris suis]|nr:hypothetical protein D918_10086 [Trichuris suis]
MSVLLDSGSNVSLIALPAFLRLGKVDTLMQQTTFKLVSASKQTLAVKGIVTLKLNIGRLESQTEFLVTETSVADVIVGVDFMAKYEVVIDFRRGLVYGPELGELKWINKGLKASLPERGKERELPQCSEQFAEEVSAFRGLFRLRPGHTTLAEHCINTNAEPVRLPPRRVPESYREEISALVQQVLNAAGIIRRSSSPWLSPAVFTKKRNGELRLCVDYRELNKRTKRNSYPLPLPDEVQARLRSATIFSVLDLHSGFRQLPLRPEDMEKTAFSPGPGLGMFEFLRMPFGLSNGPSLFPRLMEVVLEGFDHALVYIDDLLIFSSSVA